MFKHILSLEFMEKDHAMLSAKMIAFKGKIGKEKKKNKRQEHGD